jgi:hypothetical protein
MPAAAGRGRGLGRSGHGQAQRVKGKASASLGGHGRGWLCMRMQVGARFTSSSRGARKATDSGPAHLVALPMPAIAGLGLGLGLGLGRHGQAQRVKGKASASTWWPCPCLRLPGAVARRWAGLRAGCAAGKVWRQGKHARALFRLGAKVCYCDRRGAAVAKGGRNSDMNK